MPFDMGPPFGGTPPKVVGDIVLGGGFYSPTVGIIALMLADRWTVMRDPHWKAAKEPGHCDVLDQGCIDFFEFNEKDVAHINGWPNDQKEAVRQHVVREIEAGRKMVFRWRARGKSDQTIIETVKNRVRVTFQMAVAEEELVNA